MADGTPFDRDEQASSPFDAQTEKDREWLTHPVGAITVTPSTDGTTSWMLTLTRKAATSSYGAYTVTFTENGFDATDSTISDQPDINPMGT